MTRRQILDEALIIITHDRETDYGDAEDNFGVIAALFSITLRKKLKCDIDPYEVGLLMTQVKIARIISGRFKADSYIDGCGYLALAGEIDSKESEATEGR